MRLLEAPVRFRRIGAEGMILRADAAHEAGDQPPARDVVEHGVFLGHHQRIVEQRQRTAEHCDPDVLGAARERPRHDAGDRHDAVGVLVVLVDADAVEADLVGVFDLVQIAVVELVADLGIVIAIGQRHPGRVVLLIVIEIERRVGHEMKEIELHGPVSSMNCVIFPTH